MEAKKQDEGPKFIELTELKTNTGKEYEEAMLQRVDYFAKKNAEKSIFNNFIQNTVVKGLSTILDLKVKLDEAIGKDNLKKVHDTIDQILLFGL
ncbi:MAG: hypothetical protein EU539_06065 [Promethearchaeota archaeon]|nr:MAG: hypothetical protein EU539_06065 [Candidatus Lokiarchaeota archaeon]